MSVANHNLIRLLDKPGAKVPNGKTILKFKSQVVNVDTETNIGYEIENFEEFLDGMKRRWEGNT